MSTIFIVQSFALLEQETEAHDWSQILSDDSSNKTVLSLAD